jgi:signal transduction histidine kinase
VRERGFVHAWILLSNEKGEMIDCAESSDGPWETGVREQLEAGVLPTCLVRAKKEGGLVVMPHGTAGPQGSETWSSITMCRSLECEGRLYGYIAASADQAVFQDDDEERELFSEVSGDLAYALRSIELEAERRKAVEELILAKEMAESASKAKDEFLAMMSHEMRTPLNPIMGFANLMRVKHSKEPDKTYLETIVNAAKRQLGLIDNILNFTRLDKGTLEPRYSEFDLVEVCQGALRELQSVAGNLELRFENGGEGLGFLGGSFVVKGEYSMLMQLLENLLNNACKYTHRGSVTLRVGQEVAPWIRFEVIDTGVGIESGQFENLFKAFTQVDCTYTRQHEGIGLGLAICRKLIEVLGGEIGVGSEPGKGSCFWFRLPMPAVGQRPSRESDEGGRIQKFRRPMHVLLVEESRTSMQFIKKLIHAFGGTIEKAEHGKEALAWCEKADFDAVLIDLALSGMNGFSVFESIRKSGARNANCPVIGLSAALTDEIRSRCALLGMKGCLSKPVRYHELYDILNDLVP